MGANLEELYARAREEFPQVHLEAAQFEAAWRARRNVREEFAADVFLVAAIEGGDGAAAKWLLEAVQSLGAALRRKYEQRTISDAVSHVLETLTVDVHGRGRGISRYAGTGPLLGWLSVVVSRQTYLHAQAEKAPLAAEEVESRLVDGLSHSLHRLDKYMLQRQFAGQLAASIARAGSSLNSRQRALLSLHYLEAVSLDALAKSYQVHRATVARWIAQAKEDFLTALRQSLLSLAKVSEHEVDSLMRMVVSQADVSMKVILASSAIGRSRDSVL